MAPPKSSKKHSGGPAQKGKKKEDTVVVNKETRNAPAEAASAPSRVIYIG